MAQISYISTKAKGNEDLNFSIPTDESICAMLFDTDGFDDVFASYPLIYNNFNGGRLQCISDMDVAEVLGIKNDGFMNGIVYYHISQYFKFIGKKQDIYVAIVKCTDDWNVLYDMQQQSGGRIFQIGVWTSKPIWKYKSDGSIGFTSLITDLQRQADDINGKIGERSHSASPLSIVLFGNGNTVSLNKMSLKRLPNAIELNCPKVSVSIVQNGTKEVHDMQERNPQKAPVGIMGIFLACFGLCGAEESIASVKKCDLNKDEEFHDPELGIGDGYSRFEDLNILTINILSNAGYIVPINYEGIEASYFLSSDSTLSDGDFSTIANNRVIHKCRRAVCTALIPYINSSHIYIPGTKTISTTSIAMITDAVNMMLDSVMKNRAGLGQIDGRSISFLENKEFLDDDSLSIKLDVKPVNYSSFISEEVSHSM